VWRTEYTDVAARELLKLDKPVRERILTFLRERAEKLEDPKEIAEPLVGELRGLWRFRVGDYRIICDIRRDVLLILVLQIGHRKEVYR
jgi:mRNA interferase RelE/StbE